MDGWKRLSDLPAPSVKLNMSHRSYLRELQMMEYKNKAYVFTGFEHVFYYDLEKELWGNIPSRGMIPPYAFPPPFPLVEIIRPHIVVIPISAIKMLMILL